LTTAGSSFFRDSWARSIQAGGTFATVLRIALDGEPSQASNNFASRGISFPLQVGEADDETRRSMGMGGSYSQEHTA
jgi:hypothetical protein